MTIMTKTDHPMTITQDEFLALLRGRFGEDHLNWAFQCPACGDVATGRDFATALREHPRTRKDGSPVMVSDVLGQQCIGRVLGVLMPGRYQGRGCDWAAFGLSRGPVTVIAPDGAKMYCFPVALGVEQ